MLFCLLLSTNLGRNEMSLKLIGRKKGMTRVFNETGHIVVCTAIELESNTVVQAKTEEKDGYVAYQIGGIKIKPSKKKNVSKPLVGHFAKAKVEPTRVLVESYDGAEYEVGQEVGLDYFAEGEILDVIGTSKGKGYQGVMKRHGFAGGPAAHGSGFHRHAGSTGMRSTPGRCLPGVKMAGQMGNERVTVEGLEVVKIDQERNILLVKGPIPGPNNGIVTLRKSLKKGSN